MFVFLISLYIFCVISNVDTVTNLQYYLKKKDNGQSPLEKHVLVNESNERFERQKERSE